MTIEIEPRWQEGVDAEAAEALDGVREVDLVLGVELGDLVRVVQHLRQRLARVLGEQPLGAGDRLEVAVQTDQRIRGDLQVEVGALGRDEIAQRVIEIESHTRLFIGPRPEGLERCVPAWPQPLASHRGGERVLVACRGRCHALRAERGGQLAVERGADRARRPRSRVRPRAVSASRRTRASAGVRRALDVAERLELARRLGDRLRGDAEVLGDLADRPRALDELLEQEAVRVADVRVLGAQRARASRR